MYHLVDLYAGEVESSFLTKKELIDYLTSQSEEGNLGSEGRYAVFKGDELDTTPLWIEAFGT